VRFLYIKLMYTKHLLSSIGKKTDYCVDYFRARLKLINIFSKNHINLILLVLRMALTSKAINVSHSEILPVSETRGLSFNVS
jgi:hypothetical protein